mgnify:CR=1 FL=1
MNREDRIYIAKIKDILKEGRMTAYKDENKATSTEDNAYYQGLSEGYAHAYELVRKLKWVTIYAELVAESLIVAMEIHVAVSMKK